MKMLDLFSGIGGFSLAASWCNIETVAFCETDKFCQKVLNKNFPGIEIYEDIKKLNGKEITDKYGAIDIICGGFPCQPFSVAGKRKGKEDDRYLWPEMLRVISEIKPAWVVGENVTGIVSMELGKVCSDLEAEGYEVQPLIIPACGVNAPHRRNRVWIIANTDDLRYRRRGIHGNGEPEKQQIYKNVKNNGDGIWSETPASDNQLEQATSNGDSKYIKEFIRGDKLGNKGKEGSSGRCIHATNWDRDWFEVATKLCRVDDGLPNRVDRIKSLGNSIVPEVAYEILKSIVRIENNFTGNN